MMGAVELLALSLVLSVAVAGVAFALVRVFDGRCPDPFLRQRAWTVAFHMPAAALVLSGLALLTPVPRAPTAGAGRAADLSVLTGTDLIGAPAILPDLPGEALALVVLALAGLLAAVRVTGLIRRMMRLRTLVREAHRPGPATLDTVRTVACALDVPRPEVRVHDSASEAMVAGLRRPVLILPAALVETTDPRALMAVCAHELAHLKRGDHRSLWIEEATLLLQAFNPVLPLIRDHAAAAREEASDAVALTLVGEDVRPLYARALLDALRAPPIGRAVPALTFTSRRRILAMRRLKAILSPVPAAGVRSRLAVLGLGITIATVAGAGSFALAAQRAPVPAPIVTATAPAAVLAVVPPAAFAPTAAAAPAREAAPIRAADSARAREVPVPAVDPTPVAVQTAAPVAAPITNPAWLERPTPNWPAEAILANATSGVVALSCRAEADGRLADCQIESETPAGAGFGGAALDAAARARVSPRTVEGMATAGRVRFNVRMQLAE